MRLRFPLVTLLLGLTLLQGCDLGLQTSYDFDDDDYPKPHEPFDMTLLDFMNQQEEFDSLIVAVDRTGMEETFSGGEDDKTVLLLRNEAMLEFLDDYEYASIDEVPVSTLRKMLNYHVITDRLTQNDINSQQDYVYQTLVEGGSGRINVWKWRRYWEIRINTRGPDLPETAKGETVYLHNYEFTNGIAHQMNGYVQRVPFE